MRILHIAYFGRMGTMTGIVESVMNISQKQRDMGNDVIIMIPFNHPVVDGKSIIFSSSFKTAIGLIKDFRPDIVVFDGFYDKYQIRISTYLKINHVPYIIVFHGGASANNMKKNWAKKKIANLLLFNKFVSWAKEVVYLSENEKNNSVFHRCNPNYAIIPNGVNLPRDLCFKTNKGHIRILFLSRLDWYGKGLDILNQALAKLYKKGYESKMELAFYGTKESHECEELFKYGDLTKYCGYVTGQEKEFAYRSSDIFILPSRSEGMPVAVLEALSYGLPCIVTPETNMAGIIEEGDCGWVVNLDAQELINTFERIVIDFPLYQERYFDRSIETAKQFDWKVIAAKSLNVYSKVIKDE